MTIVGPDYDCITLILGQMVVNDGGVWNKSTTTFSKFIEDGAIQLPKKDQLQNDPSEVKVPYRGPRIIRIYLENCGI